MLDLLVQTSKPILEYSKSTPSFFLAIAMAFDFPSILELPSSFAYACRKGFYPQPGHAPHALQQHFGLGARD